MGNETILWRYNPASNLWDYVQTCHVQESPDVLRQAREEAPTDRFRISKFQPRPNAP